MLADVVLGAKVNSDDQPLCLSDDINMSCAGCISVKEQPLNALLELKSARSIITLLQEDNNKINAPEVTNITKSTQCRESSVCHHVNRNLIPVIHSCRSIVISDQRNQRQLVSEEDLQELNKT